MSIFTVAQYEQAIEALELAKAQHIYGNTGEGCNICGGSCHPDTCGFNPLYAMHLCSTLGNHAKDLHESLHYLVGYHTRMGEIDGPARVVVPPSVNNELVKSEDSDVEVSRKASIHRRELCTVCGGEVTVGEWEANGMCVECYFKAQGEEK